jgi:hypothetical protein
MITLDVGLLPRRSNLVGSVRWDAQSDQFPPCQTIIPTAFRSQSEQPVIRPEANPNLCDQRFIRPKETVLGPCCAFSLFGLCAFECEFLSPNSTN